MTVVMTSFEVFHFPFQFFFFSCSDTSLELCVMPKDEDILQLVGFISRGFTFFTQTKKS